MKAHKRLRRPQVAPERPRLSLPLPPPEPPRIDTDKGSEVRITPCRVQVNPSLDVPEDEIERGVAHVNFFI